MPKIRYAMLDFPTMGTNTLATPFIFLGYEMYEFKVDGMTCNHCVSKVVRSIKDRDASAKIDTDLATKKVRVDSTLSRDDVADALADAGYAASNSDAT